MNNIVQPTNNKIYATEAFHVGMTTFIYTLDSKAIFIEWILKGGFHGVNCAIRIFEICKILRVRTRTLDSIIAIPPHKWYHKVDDCNGRIVKQIDLYGTSDQLHFTVIRHLLQNHTNANLFFVSSLNLEMADESITNLLKTVTSFSDIFIHMITNNQYKELAVSPEGIANWFGLDMFVSMAVNELQSAKRDLRLLFYAIEQPLHNQGLAVKQVRNIIIRNFLQFN